MTPLVAKMVRRTPKADSYHWFDLGAIGDDLEVLDGSDPIASRLPFERCAVAFLEGGDPVVLLCTVTATNAIHIAGLAAIAGGEHHLTPVTIHHAPNGYFGEGGTDQELRMVLVTIAYWLRQLDAGASTTAYTVQAEPTHINRARAKKGKGPLRYTWRTVIVAPRHPSGPKQGGTHASPRAHDRRGHWRTYPSGKRGWVKACQVGNASLGTVFKDYKVTNNKEVTQ